MGKNVWTGTICYIRRLGKCFLDADYNLKCNYFSSDPHLSTEWSRRQYMLRTPALGSSHYPFESEFCQLRVASHLIFLVWKLTHVERYILYIFSFIICQYMFLSIVFILNIFSLSSHFYEVLSKLPSIRSAWSVEPIKITFWHHCRCMFFLVDLSNLDFFCSFCFNCYYYYYFIIIIIIIMIVIIIIFIIVIIIIVDVICLELLLFLHLYFSYMNRRVQRVVSFFGDLPACRDRIHSAA